MIRNNLLLMLIITIISFILLTGCSKQVEPQIVYYPIYQVIDCEDAVKPEFTKLDSSSYFSSKKNTSIMVSNITKMNLYISRLEDQISCYKSQSNKIENNQK